MSENSLDLLLVGSMDQPLQTDNTWFLERIDEYIKKSIKEKNAYIALNAAKEIVAIGKLSGLGLAKLLYFTKKNWKKYKIKEDFDDMAYEYVGIAKVNVERYVRVWSMFDYALIPQDHVEELQQRNIKDLIPIATALHQGYDIEQDEWEAIVDAPDYNSVAKVIREDVKGKEPRKGALALYLDKKGTLWAYQDNERKFLGSLEIDDEDEIVQKALDRIIKNSGVLRQ